MYIFIYGSDIFEINSQIQKMPRKISQESQLQREQLIAAVAALLLTHFHCLWEACFPEGWGPMEHFDQN